MPQAVTIESLPEAFEVIKEMQAEGYSWGEDYRPTSRAALARILEDGMAVSLDRHLREMARRGEADRRNGTYSRYLLTELGDIELCVPRTRRFNPVSVVRAYARRAGHIDCRILVGFVLGLSTRKVATALLPVLRVLVSASTVSRVTVQALRFSCRFQLEVLAAFLVVSVISFISPFTFAVNLFNFQFFALSLVVLWPSY